MAQDFNDYEELLRSFEDDAGITKKSASGDAPKKAEPQKSEPEKADSELVNEIKRSQEERRRKVNDFSLNIDDSDEKPSFKGGVYFSNPPRAIKPQAEPAEEPKKEPPKPKTPPIKEKITDEAKPKTPPATPAQKKEIAVKQRKKAKRAKNGKKDIGGKLSRATLIIAIIAFFSVIISIYGIRCINDVLALKTDKEAVVVTISSNMSDSEVVNILKKNDLIKNKLFCKLFIKIINIGDKEYDGGDYVSGVYTLTPDMGLEKMLSTMQADFTSSETVSLTFPEGWTVEQIAEKLETNNVCTAASFVTTMQSVDFSSEYTFIASMNDKEARFRTLEGYIYPDTYEFYVGETAGSVMRKFLDNFKAKWTDEYQKRADELGLSVDDVITMASILQGEAASADQMDTIASVLYNRLSKPDTFPWLQCDSTEKYLLETIKPTLTSSTEDTEKYIKYRDTYDTYSTDCKGLPVGPISNPGDTAIHAALNPADTSYYYFRHDKAGKVYYASSFAEHEQNGEKIANAES